MALEKFLVFWVIGDEVCFDVEEILIGLVDLYKLPLQLNAPKILDATSTALHQFLINNALGIICIFFNGL